jgi:hypothetical protein
MQQGVGGPAELQSEVAVSAYSADDDQVGLGGCLQQDAVGGAFDRLAMDIDLGVFPHGLA